MKNLKIFKRPVKYILTVVGSFALLLLNIKVGNSLNYTNNALGQSGMPGDVFHCYEHPDNCSSSSVGCDAGVKDNYYCMIDCPPYAYSPWMACEHAC